MSINTAMVAGVSALSSNAYALAVISDNISNVNTTGFKRARYDFTALVTAPSRNASYTTAGVLSSARSLVNQQGTLQASSQVTDLAVFGQGFFAVSQDPNRLSTDTAPSFTRAGSFEADETGFLKNQAGQYLLGWPIAEDGTVNASPTDLTALEQINVGDVGTQAAPTENIGLSANLNSSTAVTHSMLGANPALTAYNPALAASNMASGGVTPDFQRTFQVYDTQGGARTIVLSALKTGPNEWQVEMHVPFANQADIVPVAPNVAGQIATGTLVFNTDGSIRTTGAAPITSASLNNLSIPWAASTGVGSPQLITLDLDGAADASGISQRSGASTLVDVIVDGAAPATLGSLSIDRDGVITGVFENGLVRKLYQIPVATFPNPNGLTPERGGVFKVSPFSGNFTLKRPQEGGAGAIQSNSLESSTVDLGQEFTNLIQTQRAYSAGSKIITTADEMLQELLTLKR